MKKYIIKHALLVTFTLSLFSLKAQINEVQYLMKYNTDSCWYDCFFVVKEGLASGLNTIAFFSQFSIVSQAGDSLEIAESYQPIETNGDTAQWNLASRVKAPASQPQNDFWSVIPSMTTAFYPTLNEGDTVKLFSVRKIGATTLCGADLRIFNNLTDPNSSFPGMMGSDFSNTFIIANAANQVYTGNAEQVLGTNPVIGPVDFKCSSNFEIDITVSTTACQWPLQYEWSGPNAYQSTLEDVDIYPLSPANNGIYMVTITDALGCVTVDTINALIKPNAGPDVTTCAGSTHTLTGAPTWGNWTKIAGNANGTTLNGSPGVNQVVFNNMASGSYQFKYALGASGTCSDTMRFLVNPLPNLTMNDATACVGETLTNNLISNATGTWTSDNPSIATVTTVSGTTASITAVSAGTTSFTFTRNNTNCQNTTVPFTVYANPILVGIIPLCVGSSMTLLSNSTSKWSITPNDVVTVDTTTGVITAIAAGSTTITYTEKATGCSDTEILNVFAKPIVNITGNDTICIAGTTTLSANTPGTWASNSPLIASVNNAGVVTGIAQGNASVTFTALGGCTSDPLTVTVAPKPNITVPGDGVLCIGETVTLTATGGAGGTWSSSNAGVASINHTTGLVTAISTGSNVRFIYTDPNGCASAQSTPIEVKLKPTVGFLGPNPICINGITNVTSNGAVGTWASGNTATAIVNNAGTVTGIATGSTTLTFTQTDGACLADPLTVTVAPKPVIQFAGDTLCVGGTTTLSVSPLGLGTWASNNPLIATVNSSGVVTAIIEGVTSFVFTSNNGNCASDNSNPLFVQSSTPITITPFTVCVGTISSLIDLPGSGSWVSSDENIAKVVGNTIISVSPGVATLTYYDDAGCLNPAVTQITVAPIPEVNITVDQRCVGLTSQAFPSTGGTWTSSNHAIATINNSGIITAVSPGATTFVFTSVSGCSSKPTELFTVEPGPTINYNGDSTLCIGETAQLEPTIGGTWAVAPSFSTTVATITNGGAISAVAAGFTRFVFTSSATGCKSEPSGPLTVNPKPTVFVDGPEEICEGESTKMFPSAGGEWISINSTLASINQQGVVNTIKSGIASFIFTNSNSGCVSDTVSLVIHTKPSLTWNKDTISVLQTIKFITEDQNGTWKSSNIKVATINANGLLIGKSPGKTKVTFTNGNGCATDSALIVVKAYFPKWKDAPIVYQPKGNIPQDSIYSEHETEQRNVTNEDQNLSVQNSRYFLYPNPGFGIFEIKGLAGDEGVSVFNMQGQKIRDCYGNNCDLSQEIAGMYWIKIISKDAIHLLKAIKI